MEQLLVGLLDGQRIEASVAQRGPTYRCPNCKGDLILRKGRIVSHHFAHKPPVSCSWAVGETQQHLAAKMQLRDGFRARGYGAEVEVEVLSMAGDRRADVLVTSQGGVHRIAIEVQHQPIDFGAMERRTIAYMAAGVPVLWMGILTEAIKDKAEPIIGGMRISQYSIRPWEKWAHAFGFKELWYVDPTNGELWLGVFSEHMIEKAGASWYNQYGEEESVSGYTRRSKRWRTLTLHGPYQLDQIAISMPTRSPWESKAFRLPGGRYAKFSIAPK